MATVDEFWNQFLQAIGKDLSTVYLESFHFDLNRESADNLLELVLTGKKRATASSVLGLSQSGELPKVGDYSIVTGWDGVPRCVIETVAVTILPFREMTFEICKREGEDENLSSWRQNHIHFFTEEGTQLGYAFSEEMQVLFEDFRVVYPPEYAN